MTRKAKLIVAGLLTVAVTGVGTATLSTRCATATPAAPGAASQPAPRPAVPRPKPANVKVMPLARERIVERVTAHGKTEAEVDVTLAAEIPGRVEHVGAKLGERVRRGQVLARIDYRTLTAQAEAARASYELARTTHSRFAAIGAAAVSQQKIDETKAALTGAQANLAIARANLKKAVLRASVSGVVAARHVDRAEYVMPGKPLFRILNHRTIVITAQLPETQVARITKGALATVTLDALGEARPGTVDAILPAADPVSQTFGVRITVPNRDGRILEGMSATVSIVVGARDDLLVVPQDAVLHEARTTLAYVAKGGRAEQRTVRLGPSTGDRVAITAGLAPGEQLIVMGQRTVANGQPITIVN